MSEVSGGPGWWQASDGKWYPPEQQPNYEAPAPPPSAGYTPSAPAAKSAASSFSFDMKRWSQAERITAIASLVLLISLFLPWFTVSFAFASGSVSGTYHGWMWIVFLISLAIVLHLVLKAGMSTLPYKLPLPEAQLLVYATAADAILTVLSFLLKPGGSGVGWGFGAFVGLIAALVAAFPTAIPALRARRG
jgi:hypothetical protein